MCRILVRIFEQSSTDPFVSAEREGADAEGGGSGDSQTLAPEHQVAAAAGGGGGGMQERLRVMEQQHRIRMLLFRLVQDLCCVHSVRWD